MEYSPVTFEQLLTDLRAGNVPNATQNEILLAICERINMLDVECGQMHYKLCYPDWLKDVKPDVEPA